MFKTGTVALIGRPNTGKSTLLNNLVGQKVSITSPKPQTTQKMIYGVYEDPRGQIIFVDTPGVFAKVKDQRGRAANQESEKILKRDVDAVVYLIDHTRERGVEENRVLGMLRKVEKPKILVINKMDIRKPSYIEQYRFLEDEFDHVLEVSALKGKNLNQIADTLFEYLPEGEKQVDLADMPLAALNMNSQQYVEEIIREKAFLRLRREVPYKVRIVVDEITERPNGNLYIKARLFTLERYKKMIIGAGGAKIKEIGWMSRKELEVATGKKVYLELTVEVEE